MKTYVDMNGRKIKEGDVIIYDEGKGYAQSINTAIVIDGVMYTKIMVGAPEFTVLDYDDLVKMEFATMYPYHERLGDNVCYNMEVVDIEREVAFTVEYAEEVFK